MAGVPSLVWVLVVWRWQDPFTALYTHWKQHQLSQSYKRRFAEYHADRLARAGDLGRRRRAQTIAREARLPAPLSKRGAGDRPDPRPASSG